MLSGREVAWLIGVVGLISLSAVIGSRVRSDQTTAQGAQYTIDGLHVGMTRQEVRARVGPSESDGEGHPDESMHDLYWFERGDSRYLRRLVAFGADSTLVLVGGLTLQRDQNPVARVGLKRKAVRSRLGTPSRRRHHDVPFPSFTTQRFELWEYPAGATLATTWFYPSGVLGWIEIKGIHQPDGPGPGPLVNVNSTRGLIER